MYCQQTRLQDGRFQHQCPHCETWNDYGVWGVAHDHLDIIFTTCACKEQYTVLRFGCERAQRAKGTTT